MIQCQIFGIIDNIWTWYQFRQRIENENDKIKFMESWWPFKCKTQVLSSSNDERDKIDLRLATIQLIDVKIEEINEWLTY